MFWAGLTLGLVSTLVVPAAAQSAPAPAPSSGSATPAPVNFQYLQKYNLSAVDPQAVCMDGSPGVYYFQQGSGSGLNKWVIEFNGGSWCYSNASCVARNTTLTGVQSNLTSSKYAPEINLGNTGILSLDRNQNPFLYNWNHVWIWYCSSDSWLGSAPAGFANSVAPQFHFQGKRISGATIESLLRDHSMAAATDVLVTGNSAGAIGALNNAQYVKDIMVPPGGVPRAPRLASFKCFIDAGWFLDLPTYNDSMGTYGPGFNLSFMAQTLQVAYNGSFDKNCMAYYGYSSWKCFFAQYTWPLVQVPLLFHENLYDSSNLNYDSAGSGDFQNFRNNMTASFWEELPASAPSSAPSLMPGCETPGLTGPLLPLAAGPTEASASASVPAAATTTNTQPTNQTGTGLGARTLTPDRPFVNAAAPCPASYNATAAANSTRAVNSVLSMFAPACYSHIIEDSGLFVTSHIGTTSFVDQLYNWYIGSLKVVQMIDQSSTVRSQANCTAFPANYTQVIASSLKP